MPVRPQGPPSWPTPDPEVRAALDDAFASGAWGKYHGPAIPQLEDVLRAYFDLDHVLLCGSGTFAVELALRAVKVGPGDEVLMAAYDYPGNFFAIHALGAMPVLVDLEPDSWQMSLDRLKESIGPACKTILASHLHGGMVPMKPLMELAGRHGLTVVEDAAQCPGAIIDGKKAGPWGDVGVLSFGGSKLLTAGRGGALLIRDQSVHQRARAYQLRGNLVCPLSELQAAVLVPQLARLDSRNDERRRRVQELSERLASVPGLRLFEACPISAAGYYKVGMRFDAEAFGLSRARFVQAVRAEGIGLDEGFAALHVGRSSKRFRTASDLAEARRAHEGCVVLHHPILLEGSEGIDQVGAAIRKVHAWREGLR